MSRLREVVGARAAGSTRSPVRVNMPFALTDETVLAEAYIFVVVVIIIIIRPLVGAQMSIHC